MLKMDVVYKSNILFVRCKGALTRKSTYKITNYLIPVLKKHKVKYVSFNMKEVNKLDEQGIDAILNIKCTLKKHRGIIYLCEVMEYFKSSLKRLHTKVLPNEEAVLKLCEV